MQIRKANSVLDWFRERVGAVETNLTPNPGYSNDHNESADQRQANDIIHEPAPRDSRQLFHLFSKYDTDQGLSALVDTIDFSNVSPLHIYYCVHGRSPERLKAATIDKDYSAQKHFAAAVQSDEFQSRVIDHFLNAFPEKRRILFVHIPKCAGSDLGHHLAPRFLTLPYRLTSEDWVSKEELFEALRQAVLTLARSSEIFVHGHIELDKYLDAVPGRVGDAIFTIVRDPVEIAISQANYAVTLLVKDPQGTRPDSRRNLELLGLERLPENAGPEALKELAIRALHDPRITRPNLICQHLASGRRGYRDAIRNIVLHDIEVTDTEHYQAWLSHAWDVQSETRENASIQFLTREDVSAYSENLRELTAEDQKVFDLISWALSERGSPSIRGLELLAMVAAPGRYMLDPDLDEIVLRHSREKSAPDDLVAAKELEPLKEPEAAAAKSPAAAAEPAPVQTVEAASAPAPASKPSAAEPALNVDQLLMRFESIGENCEFGLVQRRCGAEPLGLFRFASAPLANLLPALEAQFEGFGLPENLVVELSSNGREYMVRDRQYGFLYHAWVMADEMRPEEIREREARRLPLLIRKLVEDLSTGRKLLVVRGMDKPLEQEQIKRLLAALRRYGPNTLLWVELGNADHPPGSVAWAGEGLLKGYIDRFAPGENAHDLSLDCWVAICREAERLWRHGREEAKGGQAAPTSAAAK